MDDLKQVRGDDGILQYHYEIAGLWSEGFNTREEAEMDAVLVMGRLAASSILDASEDAK